MEDQVSIIIPMYNASDFIENCLSSISKQTTKNFEVILVDDCSIDDTLQKAKKYPFKIIRLKESGGPARARNCGVKNASGNIFVFVDADIVLAPDSIEKITSRISEPDTDAISGLFSEDIPQTNFFSQFQNLFLIYRYSKLPESITTTFSYFCAIKRDVFEAVGGYNEKMIAYEDIEMGHRLTRKGYRLKFGPDLKVTHLKYLSHSGLLRDYFTKVTVVGAYYKRENSVKKSKSDNILLSLKIAGVSSGFILLSVGLIKISPIPLLLSLSMYSISLCPFLVFLMKARNFNFALKSYVVCFEVFLVSLFASVYGALMEIKNG